MKDLREQMLRNPAGDWSISDVQSVCDALFVAIGRGSHYKISHPSQREILTIPFRRPIKPVYIRKLVRFIDAAGDQSGRS